MDPFLPGEIQVMVLRYLIANQCYGSAMKLIDEMPRMKDWIPAKPSSFQDINYLKHILRTSKNLGLKECLWDYENSKILVADMLETDDAILPSCGKETLLTKIQTVQEKLTVSAHVSKIALSLNSDRGMKQLPVCVKVDISTNTDEYDCHECSNRRKAAESTTDSECQTEEVTAVQFGLQDEIPMIFCQTLLNDGELQQKIAQTINEHMLDPHGNENVVQKVSSKAESEIDKFLVDLLQDMPDDSNSIPMPVESGLSNLGDATSFADIERNLTSMFRDPPPESVTQTEKVIKKQLPTNISDKQVNDESDVASSLQLISPNTSSKSAEKLHRNEVTSEGSIESGKNSSVPSTPNVTNGAQSVRKQPSVKRITPIPLSNAHVNPVFNASVVVEKKKVELPGDKSANVSVITTNFETSAWQKLHRKPINPKIPGHAPFNVKVPVRVKNLCNDDVLKLGEEKKLKRKKEHVSSTKDTQKSSTSVTVSDSSSKGPSRSPPPSSHKRKATPMKLTPEKAKNTDFNFTMHYCNESSKKTTSTNMSIESSDKTAEEKVVDSAVKNTPIALASTVSTGKTNPSDGCKSSNSLNQILVNESSQLDATPMQLLPTITSCSTSGLKTISPNAMTRLIASANKLGATRSTNMGNFINNKKKSFSTPRKRKHVRSLSFATPPSLKNNTPGSEPASYGWEEEKAKTSRKRKAVEELPATDLKSKKRLNWPESVKKSKQVTTSGPNGNEKASFIDVPSIITAETHVNESKLEKQRHRQPSSVSKSGPGTEVQVTMPTILEESLSSSAVPVDETAQIKLYSATESAKNEVYSTVMSPLTTANSANKLTIITIPTSMADGTNHLQYFQLADDMQTLIPLSVVRPIVDPTTPALGDLPPPPPNGAQQPNVFNIVPAPLGFPDPTPIKAPQVNCLNVSDITYNGPLITPFKSDPPAGLNQTNFTLPPTPRVILDDNDSNSAQSMKVLFEGMYATNLLTSTPLKPGLPRTPGRTNSSSNSQSPIQQMGKLSAGPTSLSTAKTTVHNKNDIPLHPQEQMSVSISVKGHLETQVAVPTFAENQTQHQLVLPPSAQDKTQHQLVLPSPVQDKMQHQLAIPSPVQVQDKTLHQLALPSSAKNRRQHQRALPSPVRDKKQHRLALPSPVKDKTQHQLALPSPIPDETRRQPILTHTPVQKQAIPNQKRNFEPSVPTTVSAFNVSSSKVKFKKDKSDGEISSSEDESDKIPPKPKRNKRHSIRTKDSSDGGSRDQKPDPAKHRRNQVAESSEHLPHSCEPQRQWRQNHPEPQPSHQHIAAGNPKHTQGMNFCVGGREKQLTLSEKETLYSLITMRTGSVERTQEYPKEKPLRPVLIKSANSNTSQNLQEKVEANSKPIRPMGLNRLLSVALRKSAALKNQ